MQIVEVTGFGVRSAVIQLRHRDTPLQFVVYPMIHVGSADFYAAVRDRLGRASVVVAEGVRPGKRGSILVRALTLSYRVLRFKRRAGLVTQNLDLASLGVPVINPDIDSDEFQRGWRRIKLADRLALWCVFPFVVLGELFGGTRAIWTKAIEVDDLPSAEDEDLADWSPEMVDAFLGERDRRLLSALIGLHEERAREPIEVAVVYGAGHVPVIVHGLREHGYTAQAGEWLTVVDFMRGSPPSAPEPTPSADRPPRRVAVPTQRRSASVPARSTADGVEPAGTAASRSRSIEELVAEQWQAIAELRGLAEQEPVQYGERLVLALVRLSDQLADLGQGQDAVAAADEAVDIAEDLLERFGSSFRTAASATLALARRLRDIGDTDAATAVYAEAIDLARRTNHYDPAQRARALGTMLENYALHLLRCDQPEAAVTPATEAIELYRAANLEAPGEFARPWALAQRNLSLALGALGRYEEALAAARRSVNLARGIAPGAPRAEALVESLRALSYALRDLNRREEALAAARECVNVARSWAGDSSPVESGTEALGLALDLLASTLSWARQRPEAVPVAAEAVAAWRATAAGQPRHRGALARALSTHALHQWQVGVDDHGLASAEEAERIARELVAAAPRRWTGLLADVLGSTWRSYDWHNQTDRAQAAREEQRALVAESGAEPRAESDPNSPTSGVSSESR